MDIGFKIREAVEKGDLDVLVKLTEGQDIVEIDKAQWLLEQAVTYEHMDIVKYLLDMGVDINTVYVYDNVLSAAVGVGNIEVINFLLERGINIVCTRDDRNPALMALGSDRLDVFKLILEKEKEILSSDDYDELVEFFKRKALAFSCKGIMEYLGVKSVTNKGKTLTNLDKEKLVELLRDGIKRVIKDAVKLYKDEKIYIFSFEVDDEMSYITVYVNSEENLKEQIDDADDEDKEDVFYYKYCEDEWNVIEDSTKYFKKVVNYIKRSDLHEDDIREWDYLILDALRGIRDEGYIEKLYKFPVILTIYMHGHCDENEMIKVFKQINNESAYKEYIDHIEDFF